MTNEFGTFSQWEIRELKGIIHTHLLFTNTPKRTCCRMMAYWHFIITIWLLFGNYVARKQKQGAPIFQFFFNVMCGCFQERIDTLKEELLIRIENKIIKWGCWTRRNCAAIHQHITPPPGITTFITSCHYYTQPLQKAAEGGTRKVISVFHEGWVQNYEKWKREAEK